MKIVETCLHSDTNYNDLIAETLDFILFLNWDSFGEIETQILEKLVKVTQNVFVLFPNHQRFTISVILILFTILRECSHFVPQLVSFNG